MLGTSTAISATPESTMQPASTAKFMMHARDFESMLLGQWLQGAESSFGSVPGADEDQDAGDEQFKTFAVQQLARGITNAGGLGISEMVAKALAHSASMEFEQSKPTD